MPNWCSNTLIVEGKEELIKEFKEKAQTEEADLSFSSFVPLPTEFEGIQTGGCTINGKYCTSWREIDGKNVEVDAQELQQLKKQYGATNWLEWSNTNWGTKWDAGETSRVDTSPTQLAYYFETAWSPPTEWLQKVAILYPDLKFKLSYSEEGMGFAGVILAKGNKFKDTPIENFNDGFNEEEQKFLA